MTNRMLQRRFLLLVMSIVPCLFQVGCGKTVRQVGTEQLLSSNAVDRVITNINFSPLAGQKVYFDHQYIKDIKGFGFVNGNYIISSLRQQLMAAHCLLQDTKEEADYIVEARVGALGTDQHEISYGIPANNMLNAASSFVPSAPAIPTIPEISLAKKVHHIGAAKISVFAYHRESREPVWQSGVQSERSRSKESWFMGAGPFQSGTIYDTNMFAGAKIRNPIRNLIFRHRNRDLEPDLPSVDYAQPHMFPLAQQLQQKRSSDIPGMLDQEQEFEWANYEKNESEKNVVVPASAEEPATQE